MRIFMSHTSVTIKSAWFPWDFIYKYSPVALVKHLVSVLVEFQIYSFSNVGYVPNWPRHFVCSEKCAVLKKPNKFAENTIGCGSENKISFSPSKSAAGLLFGQKLISVSVFLGANPAPG